MDLYLSQLYHHLCDLQSVWGKNYLPNPKTGKVSTWYESAEYRGKERGWRGWVFVRAWVWVGGSIKYLSKRLPKCLRIQLQHVSTWNARSQHYMSFRPVGWFHFPIVTAHKFFVLPEIFDWNRNCILGLYCLGNPIHHPKLMAWRWGPCNSTNVHKESCIPQFANGAILAFGSGYIVRKYIVVLYEGLLGIINLPAPNTHLVGRYPSLSLFCVWT